MGRPRLLCCAMVLFGLLFGCKRDREEACAPYEYDPATATCRCPSATSFDGTTCVSDDGGVRNDAAPDAAPDASIESDAAGVDAGCACAPDELCGVEGCIASCGADVADLVGSLAEGVLPLANICRTSRARVATTGPAPNFAPEFFELQASAADASTTTFVLQHWFLDGLTAGPAEEIRSARVSVGTLDDDLFVSDFLALNADRSQALWGLTRTTSGRPGTIYQWPLPVGTSVARDSPANSGAAWADSSTVLVNGSGFGSLGGGQGLYAAVVGTSPRGVRVLSSMGDYGGDVIVIREGLGAPFVLAGATAGTWPDGSTGSYVFAVPLAAVGQALTRGTTSPAFTSSIPRFAYPPQLFSLRGARFATLARDAPVAIHDVVEEGSALSVSRDRQVAGPGPFTGVFDLGNGRLALAHSAGLLIVAE